MAGLDKQSAMQRPSLLILPLGPLLLAACIPNQADRADPAPTPPPRMDADASSVELAETQPVWTAQQVVASARTVAASTYVVQPGDTLRGIGNRTGAGSEAIAQANGLTPPYGVRAGQRLQIPGGRYHLVAEGETGIAIAGAYGVPWRQIVDVNGLEEPYILRRGQRLLLPGSTPTRAPSSIEQRAAAFRIDIDDVLTGGQPATTDKAPRTVASSTPKPLPSNVPAAQPARFAGSFAWPVKGTILSRFGPGESGAKNNGIDIATPIIPRMVQEEIDGSRRYFELKERPVFSDIIDQETGEAQGKRVVSRTERFIALSPFAPRFPFETWVLPLHHRASYHTIDDDAELLELAGILRDTLQRLNAALDRPPYNLVLHTAPLAEPDHPHYHWHIEIMPKLTRVAGFEFGSGFYINPTPPEDAARYLRDIELGS
jgi:LysM repeat protein/diadenosine tetraphosphate (Ap4A) HIT family hydrolase